MAPCRRLPVVYDDAAARRLPPLPRRTTSVPASKSKSFGARARASSIRSPQRHSSAISARLRTPRRRPTRAPPHQKLDLPARQQVGVEPRTVQHDSSPQFAWRSDPPPKSKTCPPACGAAAPVRHGPGRPEWGERPTDLLPNETMGRWDGSRTRQSSGPSLLGRARPTGDRPHAAGRRPGRLRRRAEAAPGRCGRPRRRRPQRRPGRPRRGAGRLGARRDDAPRLPGGMGEGTFSGHARRP